MVTKAIALASVLVFASGMGTMAAAGQDPAAVKKGEQIYGAQKCMICHAISGKGNKNNPLDGVGAKLSAADIRQWIVNPAEMTAKTKAAKLSPEDEPDVAIPIASMMQVMRNLKAAGAADRLP